jgi:hypothetical protein
MTTTERWTEILDDLDAALRGPFALIRAEKFEDFLMQDKFVRYLRDPRITIAEHFDINPAYLILDPLLGTLGIVEVVLAEPKTNIDEKVREFVDRAAYIRHLLLREAERVDRFPLGVELVLVTADGTADEQRGLDAIGIALRDLLRDTGSLFHIGVSVLCHAGTSDGFNGRLRRAFPWLLTATRRWLGSPRAKPVGSQPGEFRRLRRLRLTNYRLPGVREIVLSDARVHLMHGPNGSGKSSIVEALEILTSGKVERLVQAGETQYDRVIKNSRSTTPATIKVEWVRAGMQESVFEERSVLTDGLKPPLAPEIDASSFRLDQPLMDRLIGRFPNERARIFLRAFFPEAVGSLSAYEQAGRDKDRALERLNPVVERLTLAKNALTELQDWRGGASVQTEEDFPVVLNRWLEQTALVDLLQREIIVRATVADAHAAGWKASAGSAAVIAALGGSPDAEALKKLKNLEREGRTAVDDLQARLTSFRPSMSPDEEKAGTPRTVSAAFAEALDAVCVFLFTEDEIRSFGPLGHKVAAVINAGDAPTYARIVIGSDRWAEPLIESISKMLAACEAVRGEEVAAPAWPGTAACVEYNEAKQLQERHIAAGRELSVHFADKLRPDDGATGEFNGSLIAALNELIALFTPARWAYADIDLPASMQGGQLGVTLNMADAKLSNAKNALRAELYLNTAELNLFTVALFLLCIGRVPKPLNLMIFDDPLQNMDELTSVALARGLAKIVRLWADLGRQEELLLLFNGYNDLDRFSSEVAAAMYRLPWLSATASPAPVEVRADRIAGDVRAVQTFHELSPVESRLV